MAGCILYTNTSPRSRGKSKNKSYVLNLFCLSYVSTLLTDPPSSRFRRTSGGFCLRNPKFHFGNGAIKKPRAWRGDFLVSIYKKSARKSGKIEKEKIVCNNVFHKSTSSIPPSEKNTRKKYNQTANSIYLFK